jgi:replicative DNA helicase
MSGKPDVVVIDYVQIVRTMKGFTGDNKRLQIDYISAELKSIAKRTGCCVILLSQLKRTEKVEQPTMADLKESGGLEQDGDYIFMLYRPYAQDKSAGYNPETTTLFIEKNKFGEVGRISLKFNGRYQRFTEV